MTIELTSTAFSEGEMIPTRYTCDGEDISPLLAWSGVPEAAQSLALICDDPDAPVGTWVHWVLYDIPPTYAGLTEAMPTTQVTPYGAKQGVNDFRRVGYGGPCPPPGHPHRYFFRIYALDIEPGLPVEARKEDLMRAMEGHILAEGQLMGLYQRE